VAGAWHSIRAFSAPKKNNKKVKHDEPRYLSNNQHSKSLLFYIFILSNNDQKVLITCLVVSVIFCSLRTAARWFKIREIPLDGEDLGIYCAIIFYIITCILYISSVPGLYDIESHPSNPYLSESSTASLQMYFAAQIFYWSSLWAVKASLFFMFRRLTAGLSGYERMWWFVLAFGVLSFFGCIVCVVTSCDNLQAWFTTGTCHYSTLKAFNAETECQKGQCYDARDLVAKRVSLWLSLAVDLLTDLMSMAPLSSAIPYHPKQERLLIITVMLIPIHLLWNLKITVIEKLGVGVVFSVGIITMLFTIARAVSLNASLDDPHLSLTWNVLWGNVKGTAGTSLFSLSLPLVSTYMD
jgi:hypothetical protein